MNEEDEETLTLVIDRPTPKPERPEETVAPGKAFATVTGQRQAPALEFIWRDGKSLAVPYACLPLLWWHPPGLILLEYPGLFTIALKGERLTELHRRLRDQRVLWVRECEEAGALPLAVTNIAILRAYPSHEAINP